MTDSAAAEWTIKVPEWRGLLHARCAWLALPALVLTEMLARSPSARVAVGVYAVAMGAMLTASGAYHRSRVNSSRRLLLRRLDHSCIYLFVAASGTPGAVLLLHGPLREAALIVPWSAAATGIAMTFLWTDSPRALRSGIYVLVGLLSSFDVGALAADGLWWPFTFKVLGLVCYGAGAAVYVARKPNPWPQRLGFHEVFHGLVVLGVATQFTAVAGWMLSH